MVQESVVVSDIDVPYIRLLLYFAWAHQRHRQCCICHTAPEGGTFVPCDTFYAPTHTISYLWHGRECCTQNIALGTGSREQYSTRLRLVLYCSLDRAPRAIFCIQHSLPCYNCYIFSRYFILQKQAKVGFTKFRRPVCAYVGLVPRHAECSF